TGVQTCALPIWGTQGSGQKPAVKTPRQNRRTRTKRASARPVAAVGLDSRWPWVGRRGCGGAGGGLEMAGRRPAGKPDRGFGAFGLLVSGLRGLGLGATASQP